MLEAVEIIEVSPRDGIQNEKKLLSLAVKAGASRIEVTSFVNPKKVPQMAQADEICAALPRDTNCQYIGLALNRRGFERACNAGLDEVNFVAVASDTFCKKNQGMDTDTGLKLFNELSEEAPTPIRVGVLSVSQRYANTIQTSPCVYTFTIRAIPALPMPGQASRQVSLRSMQALAASVAVHLRLLRLVISLPKILSTCSNVRESTQA